MCQLQLTPRFWSKAGPMLQAALECHKGLPTHPAIRALIPLKPGEELYYQLKPPSGFKVFGLPVTKTELSIDDSGEMGSSYTSHIPGRTVAEVAKAAKLRKHKDFSSRQASIGSLMAERPSGPESSVQQTCTIDDGSYFAYE